MYQQQSSSWFRGIKGKLLFAAILPLIGFGILFYSSFEGLNKYGQVISTAHDSLIPNLDALGSMRNSRNRFGFQALHTIINYEDSKERAEHLELVKGAIADFEKSYEAYQKAPFLPGEEESHEKAKASIVSVVAEMKKIYALLSSNDPAQVKEAKALIDGKFTQDGNVVQKFSSETNKMYREVAKAQAAEAASTRSKTIMLLIVVSSIASLLTFGILLLLAQKVSSGVGLITQRLSEAARNVASSVEQLNEAGNTLSASSTEAAASLEETVASLEEMTSMVKMGSENARQAAALASSSRDSAETGAKEIQNLIQSMNEISVSSKKIEEIISVIDDIAFQTNLLALNAAVEAARAGEQGKGFAVVAEAVRTLAQRSAASAKDISGLIKESVEQISEGSDIADKSGTMLSSIVNSIKKVSDLNNEIATASQEQATGIEQINRAMSQLDQAGQSNAASAEEIAATAGEISHLATTTQNLTVDLGNIVLGGAKEEPPSPLSVSSSAGKKPVKKNKLAIVKNPPRNLAAKTIPFDDDERGKIGDASGF